jgi:hypothetical protein
VKKTPQVLAAERAAVGARERREAQKKQDKASVVNDIQVCV